MKWYDRRPFSDIKIDKFSLRSVIKVSLFTASEPEPDVPQENSKIALPIKESATIAYFLTAFVIIDYCGRKRTMVDTPRATPQVTV